MEKWRLPTIDMKLCDGCGLCVTYCPTHAVALINDRPVITYPDDCAYCGLCEENCPQDAISLHYEIVLRPSEKS